ncbi:hypothetical protein BST20_17755 [Mycobacterium branderi]|uniref:Uncharacterized protein n=2 Tax=Mycobacterium branderi TaxID=43348 RepID=A0A7I7WEW0_9MYCO|nr:hypothetical protein [Mycobacterium branderi]ORA35440.1 hypothetical protein BST20_17755 [Mycobacterium branderi]BBZ15141.1 hypothetical protein MBRA_53360 [Mycobacterium branderi]
MALAVAVSAAAVVFSPAAAADPGSPSYDLGKQAIDDAARQNPLHVANGDLAGYCDTLLKWELKSGKLAKVDSRGDFIAGCQDEGRAILGSQ